MRLIMELRKCLKAYRMFNRFNLNLALIIFLIMIFNFGVAFPEEQTVRVGVYDNPPKLTFTKEGKVQGILIDIIEEIAKQEKWKLIYVSGTWDECLALLEKGEIDLMPDVAFNSDREKIYSFHEIPVLSAWSEVYALKNSGIHSILDLNGKRVAALEGSVQEKAFKEYSKGFGLKINIIVYPSFDSVFKSVLDNKSDAAISNNFFGTLHAKKWGLTDTGVVFSPANLYYVTLKDRHPELLRAIDKHLNKLKENSQSIYYKSLKKWTSEEVKLEIPLWIRLSSLIFIGLLIYSTFVIVIFKKQLKLRTSELRKAYAEMEQRVIDRTTDLAEAMEKAKMADQIKSAFLATMSHELRTPLNSIIGFTGILLQKLAGPLNDEQIKQLSMIQKSSRHLLSLINDVLDISKIEAGQLDLEMTEFDLRASIDKTVKLITPVTEKKGLALIVNIADEIDQVYGDERRIEQIILNLLSNSAKFTDSGSLTINCNLENNMCKLSVIDTGIGIKSDEQDKLFAPFSQLDTGLSRKYEGTGLGLSICKKLIEMMNGSIRVESTIGAGSTFTIYFPFKNGDRHE